MDTSAMISRLESNGTLMLTTEQMGDLFDIDRRIKYGDESGWRGDPTMCVCINKHNGMFEVWGIDRGGNQYKAASHYRLDHTLLVKLREGDPTRNDVVQRVLDHNEDVRRRTDQALHERRVEMGDKLQWAIRRDFSAQLGTGRSDVHTIPRKVG